MFFKFDAFWHVSDQPKPFLNLLCSLLIRIACDCQLSRLYPKWQSRFYKSSLSEMMCQQLWLAFNEVRKLFFKNRCYPLMQLLPAAF